jgi:hypothetical protein
MHNSACFRLSLAENAGTCILLHIITITKQPAEPRIGAVPGDSSGAGALGITPAMLKAGVDVICENWGICGADIAPDLARDVFLAMCAQKDQEAS